MKKIRLTRRQIKGLLLYLFETAVIVLFIQLVMRLAIVHGPSMAPTLRDGDIVLVWQYGYDLRAGDVVLTDKSNPLGVNLTKRVIAVGGQRLQIKNAEILVDGQVLDEPYVEELYSGNDQAAFTVPDGFVYLLGDNRDYSVDSREIGYVSVSSLMGKVIFRVFPFASIGKVV